MPIRHNNPFADRLQGLDPRVNPFVAQLAQAGMTGELPVAHGPALQSYVGKWRQRFAAKNQPLIAEIGCHKGKTLATMASAHPQSSFVGIDITCKRVVMTAERAKTAGIQNIFCILANAAALDELFAPEELDGIVIFFPDPWIKKKRQAKNRLVGHAFCQKAFKVLSPGGFVWFKSDQKIYFDEASSELEAAGFRPVETPTGLLAERYSSTFEERFQEQGLPTYGGQWVKSL